VTIGGKGADIFIYYPTAITLPRIIEDARPRIAVHSVSLELTKNIGTTDGKSPDLFRTLRYGMEVTDEGKHVL
jgi:hypothetical protein